MFLLILLYFTDYCFWLILIRTVIYYILTLITALFFGSIVCVFCCKIDRFLIGFSCTCKIRSWRSKVRNIWFRTRTGISKLYLHAFILTSILSFAALGQPRGNGWKRTKIDYSAQFSMIWSASWLWCEWRNMRFVWRFVDSLPKATLGYHGVKSYTVSLITWIIWWAVLHTFIRRDHLCQD